jgi:hypothetical protein
LATFSLITAVIGAGCDSQYIVDAMAGQIESVSNTMFQTIFTKWLYDVMDLPL